MSFKFKRITTYNKSAATGDAKLMLVVAPCLAVDGMRTLHW